jgi:hypothetical protein
VGQSFMYIFICVIVITQSGLFERPLAPEHLGTCRLQKHAQLRSSLAFLQHSLVDNHHYTLSNNGISLDSILSVARSSPCSHI